jgi:alkanesulfonate monooxygenase SsuD/methylene tetrahydromethanopterin reductase-like flavin-dependent oxidoreductase (luciferase family)
LTEKKPSLKYFPRGLAELSSTSNGSTQITLKLVAQYADACNVFGDPATLAQKFAVLKAHCEAVGRDYSSIRRAAWTLCHLGVTDEQARATLSEPMKARFSCCPPEKRQETDGPSIT